MFYIVKSNTKSIKDKLIEKIKELKTIDNDQVFVFDYEEKNGFENAFLEYLSLSFEGKNKLVILKNSNFLNLVKVDKDIENRFSSSILLDNNNIIIMTVDKLNKTGKLNKKFKDKFQVLEKDAPTKYEINKFIINYFGTRDTKISNDTASNIINKIGDDFDLLVTELNKLDILRDGNIITDEMVEDSVIDFSRERLFKIAEYVANLNESKVKEMIKQLTKEGEGIYLIADFIIKELSKLIKYKILKEKYPNITDNEIQALTGWNIWGIKNYATWERNWKDTKTLEDFLHNIVIEKCFIEMITYAPLKQLETLEKILINNIIKIKYTQNN